MRVGALAILVILLASSLAPPATAQDASLRAALSPVQAAVDAAGLIVRSALYEASRDGTPDEAWALRSRLDTFTATLSRDWDLPEKATYRTQVLAALPYSRQAYEVVVPVPDDAAAAARFVSLCQRGQTLTSEQARDLDRAILRVQAWSVLIRDVAGRAPPGVDAGPLQRAADAIDGWGPRTRQVDCTAAEPADFVSLDLVPARAWPGSAVVAMGATNLEGVVRLESEALGVSKTAATTRGAFSVSFDIPRDAPLGATNVTATVANLTDRTVLQVIQAPSRIVVEGPTTVNAGAPFTLQVRLVSPLPDVTDAANLSVSGDVTDSLSLAQGLGIVEVMAPDEAQKLRIVVSYAGARVVAPAEASFTVDVVNVTTADLGPSADLVVPTVWGLPSWFWPILGIACLLLFWTIARSAGKGWAGAKSGRAKGAHARAAGSHEEPPSDVSWAGRGIVSAFAALVRLLTRSGEVTQGMTAREVGKYLEAKGVPVEGVVEAFERVRYGSEPESPSWVERTREWAQRTWRRFAGGV